MALELQDRKDKVMLTNNVQRNSTRVDLPKSDVTRSNQDLEQARQNLQKAVAIAKPAQAEYLYQLARVEFAAKNYSAAHAACEQCLQIEPEHEAALLLLGEILLVSDEPQESWSVVKRLFRLSENKEEVWLLGARTALAYNKPAEAVKTLQLYLRNNKNRLANPALHIVLAKALLAVGSGEEALEQLEQAQGRLKATGLVVGFEFLRLRAKIFQGLGRVEEALLNYREAIRLAPDSVTLHDELGEFLLNEDQYEDALNVFKQLIQFQPKNAHYYYKAGLAARCSADLPKQPRKRVEMYRQQALDYLNKAIELEAHNDDYWYELVQLYEANHNFKMVKQSLTQAIALVADHDSQKYLFYLRLYAKVCQRLGDLNVAVQTYEQILTLTPSDHAAYNELGEVLYRLNHFGAAFNQFRQAELLAPKQPRYLSNMSRVLLKQNRLMEARRLVEEAATYQPDDYLVRHQLGVIMLEMNQPEKALEHLQYAASSEPDNAEFRYYLGRAYLKLGEVDAAIAEYEKATTLAPFHGRWHAELGEIYLHQNSNLLALENLRIAVQLSPLESDYHYNLAIAQAANGDLLGAMETVQLEMSRLSSSADAAWYYLLGRLHLELNRIEPAIESFAEAHLLDPHNPDYEVDLAKTLRLKGESLEQIKSLLDEAIAVAPQSFPAYEELAYAYESSGNKEAALRSLELGLQEVLFTVR